MSVLSTRKPTRSADSPSLLSSARLLAGVKLAQELLYAGEGNNTLSTGLSLLLGLAVNGLLETHNLGSKLLVVLNQAPLAEGVGRTVAVSGGKNVLEVKEGVSLLHELPSSNDGRRRVDKSAVHLSSAASAIALTSNRTAAGLRVTDSTDIMDTVVGKEKETGVLLILRLLNFAP